MAKCYNCDVSLNSENESREHVLQNSIGGRLKAPILCRSCNSKFGAAADSALASAMNVFSNMLDIKRETGRPQPIEGKISSTGDRILVEPGGKARFRDTKVNLQKDEKGVRYSIRAPSLRDAKKHLLSLKRKYPKIDIEKALAGATSVEIPPGEQFHGSFDFGDESFFPAIVKTAVNFYLSSGGDKTQIVHLLPFIRSVEGASPIRYFYPEKPVFEEFRRDALHHLLLVGNPDEKILYCAVSYFGVLNYIVWLNDSYSGEALAFHHTLSPEMGVSKPRNVVRFIERVEIEQAFSGSSPSFDRATDRFNRFLRIVSTKQATLQECDQVINAAFASVKPLPDEMMSDYAMRVVKAMEPGLLPMIAAASRIRREEAEVDFHKSMGERS